MTTHTTKVFGFDPTLMPWSIPVGLDRSKRRLLTSIRYAYEFMVISHRRLSKCAIELFEPKVGPLCESTSSPQLRSEMIMHAWNITDNLNRMRRLFHFTSELSGNEHIAGFIANTLPAKQLRDMIQHFDRDIDEEHKLQPSNILGSLLWIDYRYYIPDHDGTKVHVCMIRAGPNSTRFREINHSVKLDRYPNGSVFGFVLSAHGFKLNLSDLVVNAAQIIEMYGRIYEDGWRETIDNHNNLGRPIPESSLKRWPPDRAQSTEQVIVFDK